MLTIGLSDERANVAKKLIYTEGICKGNVKNTFDYISDKFFMSCFSNDDFSGTWC